MNINPTQLHAVRPLQSGAPTPEQQVESARELRQAYRDFVGKTFFGQMLKSMRSTVGEAAYFSGGRAEEVFRSQLDQQLADHMAEASADRVADPMFRHQFRQQAELLDAAGGKPAAQLIDLNSLRRR